ncbi:MAG: polyphosphate polymerase domain-containing protein [Clostridia bacterium]|nr:polyphosphate polymerase domain-containing protein [Clostridia bacterium]
MSFQNVFKRYELKYMLTLKQKEKVLDSMQEHMTLDKYGRTTIRNLYYDTDTYLLIRRSIEKPLYKEKIRIRSYSRTMSNSTVFVELKKKYKHVVYKRRISMPNNEATEWLLGVKQGVNNTQISEEIDYFMQLYGTLKPTVFLSYEREAYYCNNGSDFRVTFDDNILCRQNDLSLESEVYGESILPKGMVLMEIKCSGGVPLWMTEVLSRERIFKTPFSKYGTAYKTLIFPQKHMVNKYNTLEVNTDV